jgi:hypothetical protein
MASLGPFESNPTFAVAVSGGPDSMALAYLASRYAGGIGGDVKAFLVDHRLRPESTEEAVRSDMNCLKPPPQRLACCTSCLAITKMIKLKPCCLILRGEVGQKDWPPWRLFARDKEFGCSGRSSGLIGQ